MNKQLETKQSGQHFCSHCGNEIEADAGSCPVCNAPTTFHGKDWQKKTPTKFIYYFIALVIFCFIIMFTAPR